MADVKDDLEPETMRKLFLGGISYDTKEEDLQSFFSQFGVLTECIVMRDPVAEGQQAPGRSRGFGFVTFKTQDQLEQAMDYKIRHGHRICNRDVDTKRAVSRSVGKANQLSYLSTKKIHVSNLPVENVNTADLRSIFEKFGEIVDVDVKYRDADKKECRRFGFVEYRDQDSVDKAMKAVESMAEEKPRRTFMLGNQSLEVKKAFSKSVLEQMKNKEMSGGSSRSRPGDGFNRMGGGMRNDSGPQMGNSGDMFNNRMGGPQGNFNNFGGFNSNSGGRGYGMEPQMQPQQQYGGFGQPPQQDGFYGGGGYQQQQHPQQQFGGYGQPQMQDGFYGGAGFGQQQAPPPQQQAPHQQQASQQQQQQQQPPPQQQQYGGYGQPPQQDGGFGGSGYGQQQQHQQSVVGDFGQNYNSGASNYGPMRTNFSSQQRSTSGPYTSPADQPGSGSAATGYKSVVDEKSRRTSMVGNQVVDSKSTLGKSTLEPTMSRDPSVGSVRDGSGAMPRAGEGFNRMGGGGVKTDSEIQMGNSGDMYNDRMGGQQSNYSGYGGFNQNAGGRGYGVDSQTPQQQQYGGGYSQAQQQEGFYGSSGFAQQQQPTTADFGQNGNTSASNFSGGQGGYSAAGQGGYSATGQGNYAATQPTMTGGATGGRRY